MRRTIIVMAKIPVAGSVKTRLRGMLSADECATLADAFLRDTIAKCNGLSDRLILAYSPADEILGASMYMSGKGEFIPQTDGGLGERMRAAFEVAFADPDAAVVMIGTDSPQLPPARIAECFDALSAGANVVLGPAVDGGIYLIGLRKFAAELFENVNWSTATVFDEICANAVESGFSAPFLLERDFDVDTPQDFEELKNADLKTVAPATFDVVSKLTSR